VTSGYERLAEQPSSRRLIAAVTVSSPMASFRSLVLAAALAPVVLVSLSPVALAARSADPLQAPACQEALAALQAQEAAARAARFARPPADRARERDAIARLQAARKKAARACLRGSGEPPPPSTVAPPPVAVPPVTPAAAPRLPGPSASAPRPPILAEPGAADEVAPRPRPPPIVTSCDAAGCWTSDGAWLPRAGPTLVGPRGQCAVQGVLLHCP
jgi:hypothetical protein